MIASLPDRIRIGMLSLLLCAPGVGAAPAPDDWAETARRDLQFAADTIATRHPGIVGGQSSVTVPLEAGLHLGLADAATVRSEQDYLRLMARFFGGFGDPHTAVNLRNKPRGWTGIVLDQVDGRYRVVWSEPGWPSALPPVGAIVRTCDDVYTGTYLHLKVAPHVASGPEYQHLSGTLARQAMFDVGLGWTPSQCAFTLPDGSLRRFALPLRSAPDQVAQERLDAARTHYHARAKPVGLTILAPQRYWLGMPDFNGARSGAAYEALYPALRALRRPAWVVFDLRGNGGGDSEWGMRALEALYGAPYSRQLKAADHARKYLVADSATVATFERYIASPEYAHSTAQMSAELAKVRAAIRDGAKIALVSDTDETVPDDPLVARTVARPHGPRLAAIIDRSCFSSCMSFLMRLRATGDAVLLGEPTIGYSPFGEITKFDLPSRRGAIFIPSAVFVGTQAIREPFLPDYSFSGSMGDDQALGAWVNRTLDGLK